MNQNQYEFDRGFQGLEIEVGPFLEKFDLQNLNHPSSSGKLTSSEFSYLDKTRNVSLQEGVSRDLRVTSFLK